MSTKQDSLRLAAVLPNRPWSASGRLLAQYLRNDNAHGVEKVLGEIPTIDLSELNGCSGERLLYLQGLAKSTTTTIAVPFSTIAVNAVEADFNAQPDIYMSELIPASSEARKWSSAPTPRVVLKDYCDRFEVAAWEAGGLAFDEAITDDLYARVRDVGHEKLRAYYAVEAAVARYLGNPVDTERRDLRSVVLIDLIAPLLWKRCSAYVLFQRLTEVEEAPTEDEVSDALINTELDLSVARGHPAGVLLAKQDVLLSCNDGCQSLDPSVIATTATHRKAFLGKKFKKDVGLFRSRHREDLWFDDRWLRFVGPKGQRVLRVDPAIEDQHAPGYRPEMRIRDLYDNGNTRVCPAAVEGGVTKFGGVFANGINRMDLLAYAVRHISTFGPELQRQGAGPPTSPVAESTSVTFASGKGGLAG